MERKEYILTNATQLFNQRGASATSLRQVANHLDMSDGNLRYHFKTKEALITAIFLQMLSEMEEALASVAAEAPSLPETIREQFRLVFFTMYRYKFLFIETPLLLPLYPAFRKHYLKLKKAQKTFILSIVNRYKKGGVPSVQLTPARQDTVFEQLFIISDSWIRYAALAEAGMPSSIDAKIDHYVSLCLDLLKPVLEQEKG